MNSAYIIAFFDKDTEVINKIEILSEPMPTINNMTTLTKVMYEVNANNYQNACIIANDRLKEISHFGSIYEYTTEIHNEICDDNVNSNDIHDVEIKNTDTHIIVYETTYSKTIRGIKITSDLTTETPPFGSRIKILYTITAYDNKTAVSLANKRLKEIISCIKVENNCIIL